jgi:hypothetical protein
MLQNQLEGSKSPGVHPVIIAEPSSYTVSTQFKSVSPNNNIPNMHAFTRADVASSHKPDPSRQTVASDALMATESSNRQRENIKHFPFQGGNMKEQNS